MPVVAVGREAFLALLGRRYTEEEFEELCFAFGLEVSDGGGGHVQALATHAATRSWTTW